MTTSVPVQPYQSAGPGKAALRTQLTKLRALRPAALKASADAARSELIAEVAARHAVISCYVSHGDEPDTLALLDLLYRRGRRILIPWLGNGPKLEVGWGHYEGLGNLVAGPRGILQPRRAAEPEALSDASLILCPALAATPTGDRLGTGGGWYDKALPFASRRAKTACLVDDSEVFSALPTDPWDIRMDLIATQTRLRGWRHPGQ